MHFSAFLLVVGFFACLCQGADIGALRARYQLRYWRHRYPIKSRVAFCKYGEYRRRECCYGWRYHGPECAPICEDGCNHGTCVGPNRCQCDKGYTGPTCDRDFNECSTKPCSHRCVNGVGSFRCFCPTGHVLLEDKVTCHWDYRCHPDRCAYGCEQIGYNFRCLCPDGLKVSEDGFHCEDIDECAEGLVKCPSDQRCRNTYGNYMCMCKEGFAFQLVNRRLVCKERNQCVVQGLICDPNAHCEETGSLAKCVCNEGYVGDGQTCRVVDANECETGEFECHADARCINTPGSYVCQCNEGFVGDGKICAPLDQTTCFDGPCFPGVRCFDIPIPSNLDISTVTIIKRYRCGDCPPGYEGDGETCADRNECEEGTFLCHPDGACVNTEGSYRCECKEGFAGDGRVCIPLDNRTCADGPCFPGVVCEDVPLQRILNSRNWRQLDIIKLFRCGPCPRGFQGDGEICRDIDECARGINACHRDATCVNIPGSYRCECNPGFAGDGNLCVPVDPTTCADLPCFNGRVACRDLVLEDILRTTDLANTAIIKLFECGPCPDGYFGNGEICQDINECSLNLFDCHQNATCVNTEGSYECLCDPGYVGDGKRCREIDPTTCRDNPCFQGVLCIDLPLDVDRLDLDSTEVVRLYICGNCPPGYRGDGEICIDIDECAEGLFSCSENATCRNVPGTYDCVCNEGFFGDGQTCIPLDPRTCADSPCFEGVECTDVDPNTLDWRSLPIIILFACGDCPEGFIGDGETCKKLPPKIIVPDNVNLTVVVTDAIGEKNPLVSGAQVKAFVTDEKTGTREYAAATTAFNGIAKIAVPHNRSILIGVEHDDFLSKSMSFKAHFTPREIDPNVTENVLTVEMYAFNELTEFLWRPRTSRALEFGDLLRLEIPKNGLQVANGARVTIECRPLNITLIKTPAEGPELVAGVFNEKTGEVELTGLEVFSMTELRCSVAPRRGGSRRTPRTLAPYTISMPVNDLAENPEIPMQAWRYNQQKGYWVAAGDVTMVGVTAEGTDTEAPTVVNRGDIAAAEAEVDTGFRLMWQFNARNFTYAWWAFGRAWPATSCVTVKACYDVDCRFPVEKALIELYGIDFRYTASRYTGPDGTVCMPYKTGGRVLIRAPCIDKEQEVALADFMPPSDCSLAGNQTVLTRKGDGPVGVCANATILFPYESQVSCGDPGDDVDGAKRFGNDFTHGNEVIYMCDDPASTLEDHTRVCKKCGEWSGKEPTCYERGASEFSSISVP
ncbi:fibrillin-1-like isoform X2 [Acanthaster planci]|uniref:Fibrillin-1-like isoform X2 n=1 Tax=Acanthaster planci TaxID=133434 RepID=A0A8B7XLT1_ACAPL|nr:fibrillin-1-like isoform X2 [Acanthaster planci]